MNENATQQALDWQQSLENREEGLKRAEALDHGWVLAMRYHAKEIAREKGTVCMDDVRRIAYRSPTSSHAWGAIMNTRDLVRVGDQISSYPSNHGRRIGVYKLREEKE
jgi:hypothetical protein